MRVLLSSISSNHQLSGQSQALALYIYLVVKLYGARGECSFSPGGIPLGLLGQG